VRLPTSFPRSLAIWKNPDGSYSSSVRARQYDGARNLTYYLDPVTGNDTNSGLTALLPKQSFGALLAALAANTNSVRFILGPGVYTSGGSAQTIGYSCSIIATNGLAILASRSGADFSFITNATYCRTGHVALAAYDFRYSDPDGFPSRLTAAATYAVCTNTAGTWFSDGADSWIHLADERAPDKWVATIRTNYETHVYFSPAANRNQYVENVAFLGMKCPAIVYHTATNAVNAFSGCVFLDNQWDTQNAVSVLADYGLVIMENCQAAWGRNRDQ
jgi:hypothetical protein